MKTREQIYGNEAAAILRDITSYHNIRKNQLMEMYPEKKDSVIQNLLNHLVRQGRIFYDEKADIYRDSEDYTTDYEMLSALWVLCDFITDTDYHSPADFPSKLLFFANGETYDVVYVSEEKRGLVEHALSQSTEESGKRIVIVESKEQIEKLAIEDVAAYCTVDADTGKIEYYKQE